MRRLILSALAMAILTAGLWAQAPGQGAQGPSTGTPAAKSKKASTKHHHHKHHHKK